MVKARKIEESVRNYVFYNQSDECVDSKARQKNKKKKAVILAIIF